MGGGGGAFDREFSQRNSSQTGLANIALNCDWLSLYRSVSKHTNHRGLNDANEPHANGGLREEAG